MSGVFLPEDLISEILLRLPIKSTVRFRCVSDSWRDYLSDPDFIFTNLTLSEAAAADEEDDRLLLVNMERPHYSVVSQETLLPAPLRVPPEVPAPGLYNWHVLSPPLDDLVCFYDHSKSSVGLWNLTTGETKMVPALDVGSKFAFVTLGFGFDERRKKYKIVQILRKVGTMDHFVAYVYRLSSRSRSCNNHWRRIGRPCMVYDEDSEPVIHYYRSYRDGTFYWGAQDKIVSFDMYTEDFDTIHTPFNDEEFEVVDVCKVKEGSMLIIIGEVGGMQYELWALLEVGVTESWTKLFDIDCGEEDRPLRICGNEVIIASNRKGRLLIRDPVEEESRKVRIRGPCVIRVCLAWTKGRNTRTLLSGLLPG